LIELEAFSSADKMVEHCRPETSVIGVRPNAARRAAAWFHANFPGDIVYALKANSGQHVLEALMAGGISQFDVASLCEIERAHQLGATKLHFMNPVKSRHAIASAYFDYGVRSFALDTEAELEKILDATGRARDLSLFLRLASDGHLSRIPLDVKYGVAGDAAVSLLKRVRQYALEVGVTFHVGSQALSPDAFTSSMIDAERVILKSGVLVDVLDIGGGFPSAYPECTPPSLELFMSCILRQFESMTIGDQCRLICEPGRALVAEAESVIVQVDARRNGSLYISDGAFGMLYDATHSDFIFPARRVGFGDTSPCALAPFSFWGPTCDSIDFMKGPFLLPADMKEGDYIEIGQLGAYGRSMASGFCGFGNYSEVILNDEPMLSMYSDISNADTERQTRNLAQ